MRGEEEGREGSGRRMGSTRGLHTPRVGHWTKALSSGKCGLLPSPGPRNPEEILPNCPAQPRPALLVGAAGTW